MFYAVNVSPEASKAMLGMHPYQQDNSWQGTDLSVRYLLERDGIRVMVEVFTPASRERGINRGMDYVFVTYDNQPLEQILDEFGIPV